MEKPRKLEDATAEYLADIDIQYAELCKRGREEDNSEQRAILVENVLTEISSRTASAACDRRTNYIMEQLCFEANLSLLIQLLQSWAPYAVFLARNRFASHVIQAVLARSGYLARSTHLDESTWSSLESTLLAFAQPLLMEISWLGREMSASHVIRSLFSAVLGLPLVAEKKGKKSKHQHSINYSEPLESLLENGHFYLSASKAIAVPESWKALFLESIEKLLSKSTHDLQTLISEVSSCAIVTMLLRLLANTEIVAQGHQLLAHLVQKVLYLSDIASEDFQPDPTNERTNSLFYTMAGDRMGSYFLETLFEVAPWEMFMNLLNQFAVLSTAETFLDYAKDASGNFIIQAIIKRLAAESPRSRKVARQALELALAAPPATAQEILLRRPMVFYWLLEATLKVKDEELALQAAEMVWNAWAEKESGVSDEEVAAFLSKTFEVLPTGPKDIKSQPQNKGKGKDKGKPEDGNEAAEEENAGRGPSDAYQVSAAKIVGATLRSSGAVRGRAGHILTLLSVPALHNIAITGALAKAILDVFFELFPGNVDLKLVGQKLASSACNLAVHFAGQHVLRKAFEASDLRGKEKWVTVLVAEKERLARSKEGRSALQIVRAELFERSAQDWRAAMKKDLKSHDVKPSKGEGKRAREESAPQAPQRGEEAAVQREAEEGEEPGDAEGEDGAAGAGKRKRKRRRAAKAE